jgi:hypothetical protein
MALRQSWKCPQVKGYRCCLDTLSTDARSHECSNIAPDCIVRCDISRTDKHRALYTMAMEFSQAWRAHTDIVVQDPSAITIVS